MPEFISKFHREVVCDDRVFSVSQHLLKMLVGSNTQVEAIVFGGSYAQGKFTETQDIEV